ncbi:MAG: Dna2/Cas4 domain-containing protein [Anaerolineales bacterium]
MTSFLAILLFVLAALLLWLSARQRSGLGLPGGRVLYEDSGAQRQLELPLFAEDLTLVGKPDYLVQSKQGLVPVEVKSGRTPKRPFQSHIFQLAAYCALVERNFAQRPPYGIIRYPQRSFTVEFTRQLEGQLLALLAEMRAGFGMEMHRSHQVAARCHACGYGQLCDQHL